MRLLLDRGADVLAQDKQDKEGYTALQYAEALGQPEAAALIEDHVPK